MLEKTLESPLDCKEIQPVHPKGDQSWVFIGRTDVEAETPVLRPPHVKSWLIGKKPWCWEGLGAGGEGDDRRWDGWMASPTQWTWLWVNFGSWWWTGRPGVCDSWGCKESDTTEWLNWTELKGHYHRYLDGFRVTHMQESKPCIRGKAREVLCGTRVEVSRSTAHKMFLKSSKTSPLYLPGDWKGWCTGTICGFTMNGVPLSQSSLSEGFTGDEKWCFFSSQGQISEQSRRGFPRSLFLSFVRVGEAGRGKPPSSASHHHKADRKLYFYGLVERHGDLFSPLSNDIPPFGRASLAIHQNTSAF